MKLMLHILVGRQKRNNKRNKKKIQQVYEYEELEREQT